MLIQEKITLAGGRIYMVGGAVRDTFLGLRPKDRDYVVTGLTVEKFADLFPEAELTGKDFPVFRINKEEYALARTERKIAEGYKGFKVFASPDVTIEQDLARRDFTINAIAIDLVTKEIIDPFGGREDLQNGIIRAVSPAFSEDPLRVYRAARFAAKYGFTIEENTLQYMGKLENEMKTISVERVFEETRKALKSSYPSQYFRALAKAGVLHVHFPEIDALRGVPQPPDKHPEGDVFEHTMQVLDAMSRLTEDDSLRFAALVHDLGKGRTPRDILPHHYGHEAAGVPVIEEMAKRLKLPTRWVEVGKIGAAEHMKGFRWKEMRPGKLVQFIERVGKTNLGIEGLALLVKADHRGRNNPEENVPEAEELIELEKKLKEINGKKFPELKGVRVREKIIEERIKYIQKMRMEEVLRDLEQSTGHQQRSGELTILLQKTVQHTHHI